MSCPTSCRCDAHSEAAKENGLDTRPRSRSFSQGLERGSA